jgi:hypothetical protein
MLNRGDIFDDGTRLQALVLKFIDKYDLEHERRIKRGQIPLSLTDVDEEFNNVSEVGDPFDVACWMRDCKLCGACIERSYHFTYMEEGDDDDDVESR